jgi:hypothetical protein
MTDTIWKVVIAMWITTALAFALIQPIQTATNKSAWSLTAMYLIIICNVAGTLYLMIQRKAYEADDKQYYERRLKEADETMEAILENTEKTMADILTNAKETTAAILENAERLQIASHNGMLAVQEQSINRWNSRFDEFFKEMKDNMPTVKSDEIAKRITDNTVNRLQIDLIDSFNKNSERFNEAISNLSTAKMSEETMSQISSTIVSIIENRAGAALEKTVKEAWESQISPGFIKSTQHNQKEITNIVRILMDKYVRTLTETLEKITKHSGTKEPISAENMMDSYRKAIESERG